MNIESDNKNHKGELCLYKELLFCQEGYCSGCEVWAEWNRKNSPLGVLTK